jgi:hypothetical protein
LARLLRWHAQSGNRRALTRLLIGLPYLKRTCNLWEEALIESRPEAVSDQTGHDVISVVLFTSLFHETDAAQVRVTGRRGAVDLRGRFHSAASAGV